VQEWLKFAQKEHEMKLDRLKETHRGLTKKDLAKIKTDMKKWAVDYESKKRENDSLSVEEGKKDVASVQSEIALAQSVHSKLTERSSSVTAGPGLTLPEVKERGEVLGEGGEEKEMMELPEEKTLVLPAINKSRTKQGNLAAEAARTMPASFRTRGVSAGGQPLAATSTSPPQGGAISDRAGLTLTAGGRPKKNTGDSQAPAVARTAFLKETAAMVRRMTSVVQEKGEVAGSRQIGRTSRTVFQYRKEYDQLRHEARNKQKVLNDLKRDQDLNDQTTRASMDTHEQCNERLESLKMQLNTVNIKIDETKENKINYDLNITHLKEEDFEHFNQLKELRKQNQVIDIYE
jgi:hypothetical protein